VPRPRSSRAWPAVAGGTLRPGGTTECSHGWSAAQPVVSEEALRIYRPCGAKELNPSPLLSRGQSSAPPGRAAAFTGIHGLKPVATTRRPSGAKPCRADSRRVGDSEAPPVRDPPSPGRGHYDNKLSAWVSMRPSPEPLISNPPDGPCHRAAIRTWSLAGAFR
jgi:hypothetical protein